MDRLDIGISTPPHNKSGSAEILQFPVHEVAAEDEPRQDLARTIKVYGGSLSDNVRQAECLLARATKRDPEHGVYQRGSELVRVVRLGEATQGHGVDRPAGALRIEGMSPEYLRYRLGDVADWERYRPQQQRYVPTDPPHAVAVTLCKGVGVWRNTPPLAGIVEAPTMRRDGSIITAPGYDFATGLYYDPGSTRFPAIPASPTTRDAERALELLLYIVQGFPFINEAARSVALSELMTPLIRAAVRTAPLFANDAPTPGTGKGLLARCPSWIATGRDPSLIGQWQDGSEEKRRLLAVLLEALPVVVIDNVEEPLKSDTLCTILTEGAIRERVIGSSRTATGNARLTWITTGNNLVLAGDLPRRALLCRMDSKQERPEDRRFAVDLAEYVPQARGELAGAVLTLVRAYMHSGERLKISPYGSFEEWSRLVREPLIWLGMADPLETRELIRAKNPELDQLATILAAWFEAHGGHPRTINEAMQADDVRSAMLAVAPGDNGKPNGRQIGKFLGRHEGRLARGLRIDQTGEKRQNYAVWAASRE